MKTSVVMRRPSEELARFELGETTVLQRTSDKFFALKPVWLAGNRWRIAHGMEPVDIHEILRKESMKEFIRSLEESIGGPAKYMGRGSKAESWVHPYLMLDLMLQMAPGFKVEVYKWIFDELIQYRNQSGDSYKKMSGALFQKYPNKRDFPAYIKTVANRIREACGAKEDWQGANQAQLKMRDKIHERIADWTDIVEKTDEAVRLAIVKTAQEASEGKFLKSNV